MLREDGKDYTILIVHDGQPEVYDESDYTYGKRIREEDIPVKIDYLKREIALRESLLDKLHAKNTEKAAIRKEELTGELRLAQTARSRLLASEIEEDCFDENGDQPKDKQDLTQFVQLDGKPS